MAETHGSTNGKKVVIQAIAIGVAAFVEQVLTAMLQSLLNWAKARHLKQASIKPRK